MSFILVTGATGTIGAHLVKNLIAAGVRPRVLVRDPAKAAALGSTVDVVRGDLDNDPATLATSPLGVASLPSATICM